MAETDGKDQSGQDTAEGDFAELKLKLGEASGIVEILRRAPGQSKYFSIPSAPINNFDPDDVAKQYGGGEYRFKVRNSKGQFMGHFSKEYDPSMKPASESKDISAAVAPAPAPGMDMIAVMNMMQQQSAQNMTMITTLITSMVQAGNNRPAGPSLPELVATMKNLREMEGGGNKPDVAIIRLLMDSISKLQENAGEGDTSDINAMLLREAISLVKNMIPKPGDPVLPAAPVALPAAVVPAALPVPQPVAPAPAAVVPATATRASDQEFPNVSEAIRQYGPAISQLIKGGMTAKDASAQFLDSVPPVMLEELYKFSNHPEAVDKIYLAHPQLMAHMDWLRDFVAEIRKDLTPAGTV